ncbi:MAG TPA: UDP-N-acetylmuramoyl-tripeptide--D-alanyl-D-alanine ligase [Candidatus Bathyarchaeia archaeon]|nr:UDP-N-acetylmuramoyl-tripeptide--D-alanyl-D-alanine ligase [Candidatus Bathyarchaeia archaeon]
MELTAAEAAAAVGGRLVAGDPDARLCGVTIDSRRVPPGALFVPLPGSRADGHEFIAAAVASGAAGCLTSRREAARGGKVAGATAVAIEVDSTLGALQSLAAAWRRRLHATVIGVAGSNGKTTTKEVLASVLRSRVRTFATPGNENSQIGAPLTILATPLDAEALVLEVGTSAPGELARLAALARPDLAVITAAAAEHLEWLGDIAGVIAAETEILDALPAGAPAFVAATPPELGQAARHRAALRIRTVGRSPDSDHRLTSVRMQRDGTSFELGRGMPGPACVPGDRTDAAARVGAAERTRFHLPLLGEPAAQAAAFAVAIARELGLDDSAIQEGLDAARPAAHRLSALPHATLPLFILDDCYNANPASCLAAIDTAVSLAAPGDRLILVLGDMLELGAATGAAHREVGEAIHAHAPGTSLLITVGAAARGIAEAARRDAVPVRELADAGAAGDLLAELVADRKPTTLLVKASRGVALERAIARLQAIP